MTKQSQTNQQCPPEKMKNPPMNVHLKARRENGRIEWDVDFKSPPDNGKVMIDLPNKSGAHDIVFHLVPTQGLNISFNTCDPIWVDENAQCPPPPGINSDQIGVEDCKDRKLTIRDANSGPGRDLTYQLNFVGVDPCDPVIRNGGNV